MSKKIRVATVVTRMKGGGVEATVMSYLRNLSANGQFDLTLIVEEGSTQIPKEELAKLDVHLIMVPPYEHIFAYLRALQEVFRDNEFDIIHAHNSTLNVFPLYVAWKAKIPVRICHNHTTAGKGETKKNIIKYILRPFAKVFPTTLCACGQYAGEWMYGKGTPFMVMPNCIDFEEERYAFSEDTRHRVRKELGVENDTVVGHVGRFIPQKNHSFILDIFCAFTKINPRAKLMLIGEGELLPAMQEKAQDLNITDKVLFLGQRSDMPDLYQAMDIMLMPSLYEGKPLVPMEAQTSGLPVIISDCVTKEIVADASLVKFLPLSATSEYWGNELHMQLNQFKAFKRKGAGPSSFDNANTMLVDFYKQIQLGNGQK